MNLLDAVQFNNDAVALLDNSDLRNSLCVFRAALACCVGNQSSNYKKASYLERISRHSGNSPSNETNFHSRSNVGSPEAPPQRKIISDTASATFVYRQGIPIFAPTSNLQPNNKFISSIIIFNLGIVYHLCGLEEEHCRVARLRKAYSFYLKSSSLLRDSGISSNKATGNAIVDLLSMALCNNLAQLNFEMLQYRESRSYFDYLIRFASTIESASYKNPGVSSNVEKKKYSLILNAIILHAPTMASAA